MSEDQNRGDNSEEFSGRCDYAEIEWAEIGYCVVHEALSHRSHNPQHYQISETGWVFGNVDYTREEL